MTPGGVASIRARLLNLSKSAGADFQLFLVRYACERFLYRLGESPERDRYILKGASLFALWMDEPYRATRDIDLLAFGDSDEAAIRNMIATVCDVSCPEDGLVFELETLKVCPTRNNQRYAGQRANMRVLLGAAQIPLQIDFGFGDGVAQGPEDAHMPTLIDGVPAPSVRAYPRETVVAEKFEAMVQLGAMNSRMKDFYDIWALSERFAFDGAELKESVALCFERRRASLVEKPEALSQAFYLNPELQSYWTAYRNREPFMMAPPFEFEAVGERIRELLIPIRASILQGDTFNMRWPARGPWKS